MLRAFLLVDGHVASDAASPSVKAARIPGWLIFHSHKLIQGKVGVITSIRRLKINGQHLIIITVYDRRLLIGCLGNKRLE